MRHSIAFPAAFVLALGTALPFWPAADAAAEDFHLIVTDPLWMAECGSCHVAYPPQLLPAASWQALMSRLDRHFGADASLEPNARAAIGEFLARNAGSAWRLGGDAPVQRVTETAWFKRKHRKVEARTWNQPAVKSAANCGACHQDAESGHFSERRIRIPGKGGGS